MTKVRYGLNIMWYEYGMIEEHFDSLISAYSPVKDEVDLELVVGINKQTYIETPDDDTVFEKFQNEIDKALARPELNDVRIVPQYYTDDDPFYGGGDFRRDITTDPTGWVVWGEVDCLLPKMFFRLLGVSQQFISDPTYILTLAYRKMWDNTWKPVEHPLFKFASYNSTHRNMLESPFNWHDRITQSQLDQFNSKATQAELVRIFPQKIDGSLLAFYGLDPTDTPILPMDFHFIPDDYIAQMAMDIHGIPQYHASNILKGHNYEHPLKRLGTSSTRNDEVFLKYKSEAWETGLKFIHELQKKEMS